MKTIQRFLFAVTLGIYILACSNAIGFANVANSDDGDFTEEDYNIVKMETEKLDRVTKDEFSLRYTTWRESCARDFGFSSNTRDCRKASGFRELVSMGANVIPLYIEVLLNSKDFFALVPYDEIQDSSLTVLRVHCRSEQMRAIETIRIWLRNKYSKQP